MKSRLWLWFLLVAAMVLPFSAVQAQNNQPTVITMRLEGALNPVMLEHLNRAMTTANLDNAEAIILELDTPGGSIDLMNRLIEKIRASKVPIIVYVSPRGAMAASAGTLITLAGHASAMAPETTIGAASPVGSQGEDIGQTEAAKVKEVLKATARSLTSDRGPKATQLAEDMIDNARAVSVDEALAAGLVDYKASSIEDLLKQLNGKTVKVQDQTDTLVTANIQVVNVQRSVMEDLLTVLANPNLVFLLLAVGVQALLIEFSHPGGWVAGFIGAVCLLLAGYGLGFLPVNWFGILFMALAFILFVLDIKALTHGALTAAGAASFIIGALVLFNSPNMATTQRVSVPLVVGTGIVLGAFFFTLVAFALRAQREPVRMNRLAIIGQVGVTNTPLNPNGTVQVGSELWSAVLVDEGPPLPRGSKVVVTGLENLQIQVKRTNEPAT